MYYFDPKKDKTQRRQCGKRVLRYLFETPFPLRLMCWDGQATLYVLNLVTHAEFKSPEDNMVSNTTQPPKGGGNATPLEGVGESQFGRLEKKLSTCLFCGWL